MTAKVSSELVLSYPTLIKKIITYGIDGSLDYMAVNRIMKTHYFCFDVIHENDNLVPSSRWFPEFTIQEMLWELLWTALYCEIPFDKIAAALE